MIGSMKMRSAQTGSLHAWLSVAAQAGDCRFSTLGGSVAFAALASSTSLGGALPALHRRSAILLMRDQLATALALTELDGVVRRLVLCPPGLSDAHLSQVMAGAEVDTIVTDGNEPGAPGAGLRVIGGRAIQRSAAFSCTLSLSKFFSSSASTCSTHSSKNA